MICINRSLNNTRLSERYRCIKVRRGFCPNRFLSLGFPTRSNMSSAGSETAEFSANRQRALILVVERNPVVQRLERYFLEQAGFTVEFASDGKSALEVARRLRPSIVVTEIMVPALDGLSLCRILKSEQETAHARVLIFSHLHAEDRAREVGADAFLLKPLSEELLIDTVQNLIALPKAQAEETPND